MHVLPSPHLAARDLELQYLTHQLTHLPRKQFAGQLNTSVSKAHFAELIITISITFLKAENASYQGAILSLIGQEAPPDAFVKSQSKLSSLS